MLKIYLQLLQKTRRSAGWTLAELMIAAALTLIVVGAAGFGLVTILRENKMANATGEMQYDSNRAGAFISEEIRNASVIENDNLIDSTTGAIDKTKLDPIAPSFINKFKEDLNKTPPTIQPILVLKIPGVAERVIYYVQASASPWRGPLVIRRWGPGLLSTGSYSSKVEPGDWKGNVLIDMVAQTIINSDPTTDKKKCKNPVLKISDAKSADATNNWYRIPEKDTDVKGFFICVRDDGQLAEVHTQATTSNQQPIDKMASNNKDSRYRSKFNYDVVTQVFARSRAEGSAGLKFPDYSVLATGLYPSEQGNLKTTLLYNNFPCDGGTGTGPTKTTEPITVRVIQSSDPDGIATITAVPPSSQTLTPSMKANQLIKIEVKDGIPGAGCNLQNASVSTSTASTDLSEMVYGTNGESLSSIIKDTRAIDNVKPILIQNGLLDSAGNLKLPDNQVLYFVELSKKSSQYDPVTDQFVSTAEPDPVLDDAILKVEFLP